ncbi:hypothetical protein MMK73_002293 [Providencia rettgeri]|nr:hypothetical protein [Providencia sp. PROV265]
MREHRVFLYDGIAIYPCYIDLRENFPCFIVYSGADDVVPQG